MSHNLNYNRKTGRHSFFSVREKAWHGLGQTVTEYPTSAEAMEYAGLNFTVEKRPIFTMDAGTVDPDEPYLQVYSEIAVPNYFATVRTDTDQPLGIVGKEYEPVQNVDAFAFFDALVGGDGGIRYETAGALGNGERIFITAKLPDCLMVGRRDEIEQYLFLTTSHDGSQPITAAFTPVRIVCQNTLNAALRGMRQCVRIRHTANAKDRFADAHRLLGITRKAAGEAQEVFNRWAKVRITDPQLKRLIEMAMAPSREVLDAVKTGKRDELSSVFQNVCEDVFAYAMAADSQLMDTTEGTVFGAYNAVTGYFQNVRSYRDNEAKLKSILYGGAAQQRAQVAFGLCHAFTKDGPQALAMN